MGGEAVPTKVTLSGGSLPYGMKTRADGCWAENCAYWSKDDVIVGGETFSTGFLAKCAIDCGNDESAYFEVKLAGKYSRLDATFGISGESTSDDKTEALTVRIVNQSAGKQLYSQVLEYGRRYPKNLDVSGVGLLHIIFEGPLLGTHGAVGTPVVYK
ncbi:hypothetical protein [Streptomyces fulvoviolaceus]|uniref:hypothetical protein n=1 Tax=Streptomyces fulvoviolaceus TaxID=285535 RepID=UPI00131E3599|nr:hypothetical protein [Streptomyces fulvoviolaceus]MCT9082209.1 hypothetical protein [Streptomyces fulvoviolaceus]